MDKRADLIGVHHLSFTVTDLDRTVDFYRHVVGLELRSLQHYEYEGLSTALFGEKRITERERNAAADLAGMELNGVRIWFNQYLKPRSKPYHGDPSIAGSAHMALKVRNIDKVRERLESAGVEFHSSTTTFPETGDLPWLWCYFRDPDGIVVELVEEMPASYQLEAMADRLRQTRLARGMTLKEVAGESNISAAHLSQVERGETIPSISTLLSISAALGVSSDYFFRPESDSRSQQPSRQENGGRPDAIEVLVQEPATPLLMTPGERDGRRITGGVEWQHLTSPNAAIRLTQIRYDPGAAIDELALGQTGNESMFVIEGTLLVEMGPSTQTLTSGMSVAYDRATPRRFSNVGDVPAIGVWAICQG